MHSGTCGYAGSRCSPNGDHRSQPGMHC